uniref:Uncharacterized protein n=1 Tax=Lepeophtheirus salmonis TaxID=72036 RepID=A0A0K2VB80_LEPSM
MMTRMGKNAKVRMASHRSTTLGVFHLSMTKSQTYAKMLKVEVTINTIICFTRLISPLGIEATHTAEIAKRLNAAEPTIVPGPSSPASKLFPVISMMDNRISGADEPRAMSVRFATVPFQTGTSITSGSSSPAEAK